MAICAALFFLGGLAVWWFWTPIQATVPMMAAIFCALLCVEKRLIKIAEILKRKDGE